MRLQKQPPEALIVDVLVVVDGAVIMSAPRLIHIDDFFDAYTATTRRAGIR